MYSNQIIIIVKKCTQKAYEHCFFIEVEKLSLQNIWFRWGSSPRPLACEASEITTTLRHRYLLLQYYSPYCYHFRKSGLLLIFKISYK